MLSAAIQHHSQQRLRADLHRNSKYRHRGIDDSTESFRKQQRRSLSAALHSVSLPTKPRRARDRAALRASSVHKRLWKWRKRESLRSQSALHARRNVSVPGHRHQHDRGAALTGRYPEPNRDSPLRCALYTSAMCLSYLRTAPASVTGICSTISIPKPCKAGTWVGVLVSKRILWIPRSDNICPPSPT